MSTSMTVTGFHPPNEEWREKAEAFWACKKAGVSIPQELWEFFGHDEPDERGVELDLRKHSCCSELQVDYSDGYEIDLRLVPKELTHLRFRVSY